MNIFPGPKKPLPRPKWESHLEPHEILGAGIVVGMLILAWLKASFN